MEASYPPPQVFLSFRGEVRNTFTCFLYDALKTKGFDPFMDKADIDAGEQIRITIGHAINNSKGAIVVFSKNFAYSRWCLDELVQILSCQRSNPTKYILIPILYDVKSADIKYQLRDIGAGLQHLKLRHGDKKVEEWRTALVQVGEFLALKPMVDGMMNEFIADIVKIFRKKYDAVYPAKLPYISDGISVGQMPNGQSFSTANYNGTPYVSPVLSAQSSFWQNASPVQSVQSSFWQSASPVQSVHSSFWTNMNQ